jgi:hypothetical protein
MKTCVPALALSLALLGAASGADRSVVVPDDAKPFEVKTTDIVRLTGRGISGGEVEAKVIAGKAKVVGTNTVSHRKNGGIPVGALIREFEVAPAGKGGVKVRVSVTGPAGGGTTDTDYEFEVE